MIRPVCFVVSGFLAASPVAAETIVLRSGEHDGFSRIVLPIPAGTEWSLTQSMRQASLSLNLPDVRFDTTQVFNWIPRDRMFKFTQDEPGAALKISLGCNCTVAGFKQGETYLVIDVSDPKAEPGFVRSRIDLANASPYQFRFSKDPGSATPGPTQEDHEQTGLPDKKRSRQAAARQAIDLPRAQPANASERRLMVQIERASNQGLLTRRGAPTSVSNANIATPSRQIMEDRRPTDLLTSRMQGPEWGAANDNVSISTVVDRDAKSSRGGAPRGPVDRPCLPDDMVNVPSWASSETFAQTVGNLRSNLYSEFDRVDPETAVTLARTYLYFGFGAEARRVLSLLPAGSPDMQLLIAFAGIVDGDNDEEYNVFAGQMSCDGDAAMWSVLAGPVGKQTTNPTAVQRSFARLPEHLRLLLGPRLASRFADAKDGRTANAILRAVARSAAETTPEATLVQAEIAVLQEDDRTAVQKLEQVAETGSEQAPQALIQLVTSSYRKRATVAPDIPDLVAAYALEFRRTGLGPDLRKAHALSLALSGRYTEAMNVIAEQVRLDGPKAETEAMTPVLTLLTEQADDVTFLQFALAQASRRPAPLSTELDEAIARRLLDLGFPEAAMQILSDPSISEVTVNRRLMRATAALSQRLPNRALVELLGLEGPEADRLRASALLMTGNYQDAGELMLRTDDKNAAARGFWLSGVMSDAPSGEVGKYHGVVEVTKRLVADETEPAETTPLAQARNLVQSSEDVRNDVALLFDSIDAGDGENQ